MFTWTGPQRVWTTEPVVVLELDDPLLPDEPEADADGLLAEGMGAVLAPAAGLAWLVEVW
jgi:hypothetical protein